MKRIKNFTTLYIVLRNGGQTGTFPVASCATLMRAEELVGKYTQEMKDYGITRYTFEAAPCTYYDE